MLNSTIYFPADNQSRFLIILASLLILIIVSCNYNHNLKKMKWSLVLASLFLVLDFGLCMLIDSRNYNLRDKMSFGFQFLSLMNIPKNREKELENWLFIMNQDCTYDLFFSNLGSNYFFFFFTKIAQKKLVFFQAIYEFESHNEFEEH